MKARSPSANAVDTKDKLITWLASLQNCLMVGMAAVYLYEFREVWHLLENAELGFVPKGRDLTEENVSLRLPVHFVGERMQDSKTRAALLNDFREYLLRNTLKESLEHTREYCVATKQEQKLFAAPWFHFARVVRNAITHDNIVRFDKHARPPLTFERWMLDASHEGIHIADTPVASTATVPLIVAIQEFAEKELD